MDKRFWVTGGSPNGALTFELNGTSLSEVAIDIVDGTSHGSGRYTLNMSMLYSNTALDEILAQQNSVTVAKEGVRVKAVSLFIDSNSFQCDLADMNDCASIEAGLIEYVSVPEGSTIDISPFSLTATVVPPGGYFQLPNSLTTVNIQSGEYSTDSCPCGLCMVKENSQVRCLADNVHDDPSS